MPETNSGLAVRMTRAEADIQKLDNEKADAKDVQQLARSFDSLRTTLQWFMGIMATAAIAGLVLIAQLAGG